MYKKKVKCKTNKNKQIIPIMNDNKTVIVPIESSKFGFIA